MLLAIAATEFEMKPFQASCRLSGDEPIALISGVGLLESAVTLTRFLEKHHMNISSVVNFGIGGAYIQEANDQNVDVLDLCLASCEILGDYGVCSGLGAEPFPDPAVGGRRTFQLSRELLSRAEQILGTAHVDFHTGSFVTVNGASSTAARGTYLRDRYSAICENMEGAAIARVCEDFSLPLLEIRAISNLVEDRPGAPWRLHEACDRAARTVAILVQGIKENA